MKDILKSRLKPLYENLISKLNFKSGLYPFCIQWGSDFPKEKNTGILFVGKATNGWLKSSSDVDLLFGDSKDSIFARKDQMKWVSNLENNNDGYNTRKSAFWRIIKATTETLYPKKEWYSIIAWSNLYKISFEKGNPNEKLKLAQKEYCKKILEEEINILSPKYVVFLTSGWDKVFLKHLNEGTDPIQENSILWNEKYYSKSYTINNVTYISTKHPQGKNEEKHVKVITELINNKKPMPNNVYN